MLCAWTSAIATLLLPRRLAQPLVGRRRVAAVCLSDDLIFFPSVESSLTTSSLSDNLLFCESDEGSLSDLSKSRSLNEAEHVEACDTSERRFSHAPPEGVGVRAEVDFDRYSFPGTGYLGTDATPPAPFVWRR